MRLSDNDIECLLQLAKKAALKAGEYIQQFNRSKLDVIKKEGGNSKASQVVTEVDINCQKIILSILSDSIDNFDLGVLTEELEDNKSRFEKDYFWCVDPLDGTLPFIEGRSGYSVSIALVSKAGESLLGVIYDPLNSVLYSAAIGRGAFRNEKAFSVSANNQKLTFVSDRSFMLHSRIEEVKEKLIELSYQYQLKGINIIEHGGAAMNAMWMLEHAPSCYFKFPKEDKGGGSLWDYAASARIVQEADAFAFDFKKEALKFNDQESTFMNRSGVFYASTMKIVNDFRL